MENLKYIAVGIMALAFLGTAIGQGIIGAKAVEAVGRNPEAEPKIRNIMIISSAITESGAIYGFVISLILLFVAG